MALSIGAVFAGGDPPGAGSQGLGGLQTAGVSCNALAQQPEVLGTAKPSNCRLPCWVVPCSGGGGGEAGGWCGRGKQTGSREGGGGGGGGAEGGGPSCRCSARLSVDMLHVVP